MPSKKWVHHCEKSRGSKVWLGVEICPDCGQRGEYDGYHLGMNEAMGAYQQRTGFRPIGPHREMEHELLGSRMKVCERCNGKGVIDKDGGESYEICPRCHMAQYLFDGSHEEFEAIRQRIMDEYPEADVNSPLSEKTKQARNVGGGFFRPKPRDKSLQAYKDWMNTILTTVKTSSGDDDSMTEEKWIESWKEFWSKVDKAKDNPVAEE